MIESPMLAILLVVAEGWLSCCVVGLVMSVFVDRFIWPLELIGFSCLTLDRGDILLGCEEEFGADLGEDVVGPGYRDDVTSEPLTS